MTYAPDAQIMDVFINLLSSMISSVFTIIPVAIGIVGGLIVTIFGVSWLKGLFWRFQHRNDQPIIRASASDVANLSGNWRDKLYRNGAASDHPFYRRY